MCGLGTWLRSRAEVARDRAAGLGVGGAWRRAQIVFWSAQAMDVPAIAKIAFTSEDRVREVIHNFNADGSTRSTPKYAGGRPPKFTLPSASRSRRSLCPARRSWPAVFDLEPVQAGRVPGR